MKKLFLCLMPLLLFSCGTIEDITEPNQNNNGNGNSNNGDGDGGDGNSGSNNYLKYYYCVLLDIDYNTNLISEVTRDTIAGFDEVFVNDTDLPSERRFRIERRFNESFIIKMPYDYPASDKFSFFSGDIKIPLIHEGVPRLDLKITSMYRFYIEKLQSKPFYVILDEPITVPPHSTVQAKLSVVESVYRFNYRAVFKEMIDGCYYQLNGEINMTAYTVSDLELHDIRL